MALTKIDDRGVTYPLDLLDNEKIRFGTGNDLEIYHDGSDSWIKHDGDGSLYLNAAGTSEDIYIRAADNVYIQSQTSDAAITAIGNGQVELYYDGVKKFATTSTGVLIDGSDTTGSEVRGDFRFKSANSGVSKVIWDGSLDMMRWQDGYKATFGSGSDLQIYHDGSHNFVHGNTGNLSLSSPNKVQLSNASGDGSTNYENMVQATANAAVELYYDNSKKFETTSGGGTLTGHLNATSGIIIRRATAYASNDADELIIGDEAVDANQGITILAHTTKAGLINFGDGDNPYGVSRGSIKYDHADDSLAFSTGATERLRIDSSGNVGIGTTSPSNPLHVRSTTTDLLQLDCNDAGNLGAHLKLNHDSSSPADDDVVGAIEFSGKDSGGNATIYSRIRGVALDVTDGTEDGALVFGTRANASFGERMRIDSDGIKFNGDTAATNGLSEYEEGTWVPTVNSNMTLSTSYDQFGYVKVGAMVTVRGLLDVSAVSGTDAVTLSLPFTPSNWSERSNRGGTGAMFKHVGGDYGTVAAYTANGNVNMHFYRCQGNDSTWSSVSNNNISTSTQIYFQHTYFHG